jgi:hypothetical protein
MHRIILTVLIKPYYKYGDIILQFTYMSQGQTIYKYTLQTQKSFEICTVLPASDTKFHLLFPYIQNGQW